MVSLPSAKRHAEPIAVAALLGLFAWLSYTAGQRNSVTFDEPAFIVGGYTYWTRNDYRLNPEGGNWMQRWCALPLLLTHCGPVPRDDAWRQSDEWRCGREMLFGRGADLSAIVTRARAMMLFLAVCLGLLIYLWSRSLFGRAGAFISLVLYTLSPSMLGHADLAVVDIAVSGWLAGATWALWNVMHRVSWGSFALAALALAALCLTKFSAVLILPLAAIMLLIRLVRERPLDWRVGRPVTVRSPRGQAARLSAVAIMIALVLWTTIWASYGFRFTPYARGSDPRSRLAAERAMPNSGPLSWLANHRVLPRAYIHGFAYTLVTSDSRCAFLNGDYSGTGWPWFFPYCLLVKNPLSFFIMLAMAAAAILLWSRARARRADVSGDNASSTYDLTPLMVLLLVYGESALTSRINIGYRHFYPVFVALCVLCGASGLWLRAPGGLRLPRSAMQASAVILILAMASYAYESVRIRPHYVAYFNGLAGGPAGGYRHLVDSSLDWGQSLSELRDWLAMHRQPSRSPVYLSYFGSVDPRAYGIDAIPLPSFFPSTNPPPLEPLKPGVYCISATMLQAVCSVYPGPWNPAYEARWKEIREQYDPLLMTPPGTADQATTHSRPIRRVPANSLTRYEQLRFSRLCAYLRRSKPLAQPGYSIFVYALNRDQLEDAQFGVPHYESEQPLTDVEYLP